MSKAIDALREQVVSSLGRVLTLVEAVVALASRKHEKRSLLVTHGDKQSRVEEQ